MTTRKPVSYTFNRFYDSQRVDQDDMDVEQDRHVNKDASIVQNHFGSGVLPTASVQKILFDTDNLFPDQVALIASNDFDGTGLRPFAQPTDNTLGNQLEVQLTDSTEILNGTTSVGGRFSTKVLIIGLDFQGNIQYDRLYFYKKEKQVTQKHYALILSVFFNDFYGNNNCSRQLGGRVIIRETNSFQLSRDPIMIAQDVEPNIFFRDFKTSNTSESSTPVLTLYQAIQSGIGTEYNVDALNINTTVKREFQIGDDVTTRLAQKFIAKTNNIQKITVLLGVRRDTSAALENRYDWSGELIVSIFELQSNIECPTDLVPELAIEFSPNPVPLTQFSIDQSDLEDQGYVLNDVLQPVDLVFNNSQVGDTVNPVIEPGKYYAISFGRAGDASTGTIFTGIGNSQSTEDRFSIFTGEWTDVPEEDLWYQVWTDAAKASDGFAYDAGNGMEIPKTNTNDLGAVVDYSFGHHPFVDSGQNTTNTAIVEAVLNQFQQEQDERTGNPVFARQKFEPSFSFVTNSTLSTLRETSEPLIIGCGTDINAKSNSIISGTLEYPGLVNGNVLTVINPDADLISQRLIGSKLTPNDDFAADYKIVRKRICTDGYGDVNGDGVIDEDDVIRATQLIGQSLSSTSTQEGIRDGYYSTLEIIRADVDGDGYVSAADIDLISDFVARNINSFPVGASFQHIEIEVQNSTGRFDGYFDCTDGYVRLDGYVGSNVVQASSLSATELKYYGYNGIPNMFSADPAFSTVPWVEVDFSVRPVPFWQDYLLQFSSEARLVPATFTFDEDSSELFDEDGNCAANDASVCIDSSEILPRCNPGRNDFFVPDNLIIGKGQILTRDGSLFRQDLEIVPLILELPQQKIFDHAVLNVFTKLIADAGDGFTSVGYPALKFSDCSTVGTDALARNQIRFGVTIQSRFPNADGYDDGYGYGVIVDDLFGINIDQSTGILTVTVANLDYDSIFPELRTKIEITVYLKKAGWNNSPFTVPADQLEGLFASGVSDP